MLSSSMYLFLSKVIGYGIRIILPVFLVRLLVKEDFGTYSQFFLLEVLIKTFYQMGINQSLYFFIPRDKENSGSYLVNSFIQNTLFFLIAYSLVWVFRFEIAEQLGMPLVHKYFWYLGTYSLLMMFNVTVTIYLTAQQKVLVASGYTILREILASIATLIAAFTYGSLSSIFMALIISRALSLVFGLAYVHFKTIGFRSDKYFKGFMEQFRYGAVLGLAGMAWTLTLRLHEMAISRFYDLETYAVYAAGCKQIPILQFFGQSIAAVSLSQFASMEKMGDWAGIRKLWDKVLGSMYGVGIPVTLLFLLVSKPMVLLMFTPEYADAIPIFRINTLVMMTLCLNPTLVLRALDRNDISAKTYTGILIVMPFAYYWSMKAYGPIGIITAHLIFNIAGRLISNYFLNRISPVYLPYFASPKSIWEFYQSIYGKTTAVVRKFTTRLN